MYSDDCKYMYVVVRADFTTYRHDFCPFVVIVHLSIVSRLYTQCTFIPTFITFTFVVTEMHTWEVRNDFNKDKYKQVIL